MLKQEFWGLRDFLTPTTMLTIEKKMRYKVEISKAMFGKLADKLAGDW